MGESTVVPEATAASGVHLQMRRRADVKIARALRIEALRLAGLSHDQTRVHLGLTVEQYRRARRWLRDAVTRSLGASEPVSIEGALREHGAHAVAVAVRVGALRVDGHSRAEARAILRLSEEEYSTAIEWLKDAIAAAPRN